MPSAIDYRTNLTMTWLTPMKSILFF